MALTKVSTGMLKADAASVDLNIDANTLYIDVSTNRVGVGKTNPATSLDVAGTITATALAGPLTGNASTVTTNANLTGDITSIGNATVIAAGVIIDADVKSDAAIAYSKLGTIPTWNQNTTGSAATLTTARAIGGVNFDGSAAIVPSTIAVADTAATTSFVGLW